MCAFICLIIYTLILNGHAMNLHTIERKIIMPFIAIQNQPILIFIGFVRNFSFCLLVVFFFLVCPLAASCVLSMRRVTRFTDMWETAVCFCVLFFPFFSPNCAAQCLHTQSHMLEGCLCAARVCVQICVPCRPPQCDCVLFIEKYIIDFVR